MKIPQLTHIPQLPYIKNISYQEKIDFTNQKYTPQKTIKKLEKILEKYRKIVDKQLEGGDFGYDTIYPIGHCGEIRNAVFELLEKNVYLTNGKEFKKIYGIQEGLYFQNAIQIGDTILDVANDTVESNDKKIIISKISEKLIRNIKNYHDFCEVAEKYWGYKIIPNIYLKNTQNKYPFFFQRKDGVIFLPDFINFLNREDEKNNFFFAKDFLANNKYKNNTLNKEYIKLINNGKILKNQTTPGLINKEFYKLFLRIRKIN